MSEIDGLEKMRKPFEAYQIGKLPKPTKQQTEAVKSNFKNGTRCTVCGAWHHPQVVHLDYVGHAAITDRLLDCDPKWSWEPMSTTETGLPRFDENGGLWIKLTVCGVTRLGYGNAPNSSFKDPGDREKEVVGDALRNAAMRFGAALDLWHKGDSLHPKEKQGDKSQSASVDIEKKLKDCKSRRDVVGVGNYAVKKGGSYMEEDVQEMIRSRINDFPHETEKPGKPKNNNLKPADPGETPFDEDGNTPEEQEVLYHGKRNH